MGSETGLPAVLRNLEKLAAILGVPPMNGPRQEVVRYFQALNDYRDKEAAVPIHDDARPEPEPDPLGDGEGVKAVVVAYLPGDRVRLIGADPEAWGFVTGVIVRESGVLYSTTWPVDRRPDSQHFGFELEPGPED